jgi:hypothetical protein
MNVQKLVPYILTVLSLRKAGLMTMLHQEIQARTLFGCGDIVIFLNHLAGFA